MIDPTVFDNLKVIIEGYIYDLDLDKQIVVTNRSDIIDIAAMSRKYSISFSKGYQTQRFVTIEMGMEQKQIAGELLKTIQNPSCKLKVIFQESVIKQEHDEILLKKLNRVWGNHMIKHLLTIETTSKKINYLNRYEVEFLSLFGEMEEEIEELLRVIDHSISFL